MLAIDKVPGSLEYLGQFGSLNSSGIEPSLFREISPLPGTLYFVFGAGPPVPARLELGSLL